MGIVLAPNCPYLLGWVKTNGSLNKYFVFFKAFLPSFLILPLSFLLVNCDSISVYVHTFQHALVKREKDANFTCLFLWTAMWEVRKLFGWHIYARMFSCSNSLPKFFHNLLMMHTSLFSSLPFNLFIYVETIRIILCLVPVSLRRIDIRRRIMGECPCIVWSDQGPVPFHQKHARLLTLASRLLLQ